MCNTVLEGVAHHHSRVVMVICFAISGCVPVQPSESDLVGVWGVVWECGTERLDLKSDATYIQHIDYASGGTATRGGTWRVAPGESRVEGGQIVLKDAMQFCSVLGEKLPKPEQTDRQLETIWEWGRLTLSFYPDIQGFERQ